MSQALVIHAPHDLRIETRDSPDLCTGQVHVRVEAGGLCGSDLHYYHQGGFGAVRIKHPLILGHEVAGRIAAVAQDVHGLAVGDIVAINPGRPCLNCVMCRQGLTNHCLDMRFYGSAMRDPHVDGAFRQDLVCEATQCVVGRSKGAEALVLAEPFAVALHAVSRAGALMGKRVLVTGSGPIGALVAVAARFMGAREVIVTDILDVPLATAKALGADEVINSRDNSNALSALYGTIDILFECSANEQALRSGIAVMAPCGEIVQVGLGEDATLPLARLVAGELSWKGSFRFRDEFSLAVALIDTGRVDLSTLVTQQFPLSRAIEAFDMASDRQRAMKVLMRF